MTTSRHRHPPAMPEGFVAQAASTHKIPGGTQTFRVTATSDHRQVGFVYRFPDDTFGWSDGSSVELVGTEEELCELISARWAQRRLEGE